MVQTVAIEVKNLSKSFRLPHEKHASLKQAALSFRRKKGYEMLNILEDISFEVKQGEFFGIVGRNGSGKSTMLKTLAGIYVPTSGSVKINGKLTPFIELGVGFNPELSGRDNVFLNGTIFGMDHRQIELKYDEIVRFAELEKFMDQKLKNYSSGMQVRLAFSIAVQAKTEILLIDEVLAVGDAVFQQKCFKYFKELKKSGRTVIFVSHDTGALQEYCDRGILIEGGKVLQAGPINTVVKAYLSLLNASESVRANEEHHEAPKSKRWGIGGIYVESASTYGENGNIQKVFSDDDRYLEIAVSFKADSQIEEPVYGITVTDAAGQRIFDSNTMWSRVGTSSVEAGQTVESRWIVPNIFNSGDFFVTPAVADRSGVTIYDWYDDFLTFKVRKELPSSAHTNVKHEIRITEADKSSK